ncbi:hypothetical protein [Paraglaciecola sp. 20A4]|uniref:hypothetical protein n=1 Tax=Paraglaciecola sp. 20A4 TaxID=2687288 RepID=UPI001407E5BC|nr:hypothetical protein [Paraglaciecola sp. 20A4]
MTSDLLFSILPREGKEPISRDELKVKKIDKKDALGKIDEDDEPYHPDKDDPREKKRLRQHKADHSGELLDEEQAAKEQAAKEKALIKGKSDDPKFIDIEV